MRALHHPEKWGTSNTLQPDMKLPARPGPCLKPAQSPGSCSFAFARSQELRLRCINPILPRRLPLFLGGRQVCDYALDGIPGLIRGVPDMSDCETVNDGSPGFRHHLTSCLADAMRASPKRLEQLSEDTGIGVWRLAMIRGLRTSATQEQAISIFHACGRPHDALLLACGFEEKVPASPHTRAFVDDLVTAVSQSFGLPCDNEMQVRGWATPALAMFFGADDPAPDIRRPNGPSQSWEGSGR